MAMFLVTIRDRANRGKKKIVFRGHLAANSIGEATRRVNTFLVEGEATIVRLPSFATFEAAQELAMASVA